MKRDNGTSFPMPLDTQRRYQVTPAGPFTPDADKTHARQPEGGTENYEPDTR